MASDTRKGADRTQQAHPVSRSNQIGRGMSGWNQADRGSFSPFSLMRQGIDEMDRWFSRFASGRGGLSPGSGDWLSSATGLGDWTPAIEAFQRGNEFVIRADVPGMNRRDLHVEVGEDMLTITGERKREHQEQQEGVFWTERSYGSFSRVVPLPPGVISDSAKATFNNGVLEIVMPSASQEARKGRRIDIAGQ